MTVIIENANAYGALDEATLTKFEEKIGSQLPEEYREFLKRYNGGTPKPAGFWIEEGNDGIGNLICLCIRGDSEGAIYFIDHEIYSPDDPETLSGLTKLADSFSEFLSKLQELPE